MLRFDDAVDALDQQRELVTAEACGSVRTAQARADPRSHLDEQCIARGVAERVVDALEVVDVEEDHRDARAALRAARQREVDVLSEQRAVGEVGQRVVVRLMRELFLQLGESRDRALHAAVLEDHRRARRERAEQLEVALVEGARVEVPADHEAADHSRLTAQQGDHGLAHPAALEHLRAGIVGRSDANDHAGGFGLEHVVELTEPERHHDLVRDSPGAPWCETLSRSVATGRR